MLKIWGRLSSINVQKVVWCARELGLAFERVDAGMDFGIVDTPAFRRLNPNAMVPVIEDDGFVLWESNAIVRYLCAKHGARFVPPTLTGRADADRWLDWQCTEFSRAMGPAFLHLIRTPEPARDGAAIRRSVDATGPLLAILDDRLAGHAHVCGADFTLADIPLGCAAHRWYGLPIAHAGYANVRAWYERLLQRPAVQGVLTLPLV